MGIRTILLAMVLVMLAGCQTGRYTMKNDKAPLRKPTSLEMQDAIPTYQPIYKWSVKPYTVRGKRYHPLKTAEGYRNRGQASWYGRKFHGHLTANGEIYDMYAMTAAHKTLPIPSFVRVTNQANGKSIIVRVNDRGPFHGKRIIDLSYSAAYALDMLKTGVAEVSLETIVVKAGETWTDKPAKPPLVATETTPPGEVTKQLFVQVLAGKDGARIRQLAGQLTRQYRHSHVIPEQDGVYRLRLGPIKDESQAQSLIRALKNNGYGGAYMLYSAPTVTHN